MFFTLMSDLTCVWGLPELRRQNLLDSNQNRELLSTARSSMAGNNLYRLPRIQMMDH